MTPLNLLTFPRSPALFLHAHYESHSTMVLNSQTFEKYFYAHGPTQFQCIYNFSQTISISVSNGPKQAVHSAFLSIPHKPDI